MKRILCLLLALLLLFGTGCVYEELPASQLTEDGLHVYFLDVGQADCALILSDGHAMLIDGGNTDDGEQVVSFLREKGVAKLDYVVGTHAHEDHVGGLAKVLESFAADTIYSPVLTSENGAFNRFRKASEKQGGLTECLRGTTGTVGKASFTVLWPVDPASEENVNNTSIVLYLTFGRAAFLFTGDLERDAEGAMLTYNDAITSTVLKVGHHGSSDSTGYYLLRRTLPQYAVISCGKNNDYGHPHEQTLEILRQAETTILRTDTLGTIAFSTDGELLTVFTRGSETTLAVPVPTPALDARNLRYIGNKNSRVFHTASCENLPKQSNRVEFETRADATAAGYRPCPDCRP